MTIQQKIRKMQEMAEEMVGIMQTEPKIISEKHKERFWSIADGLTAKYFTDTLSGKCSLEQQRIPLEEIENSVRKEIAFLRGLKKLLI